MTDSNAELPNEHPVESKKTLINQDLKESFNYYLSGFDQKVIRDQNGVLQVLSVGCGYLGGIEAESLSSSFTNFAYKGIDINSSAIEANKSSLQFMDQTHPGSVRFEVEDAQNVDPQEKSLYGFILIRNPRAIEDKSTANTEVTPPVWARITKATIQKLTLNGYLLVTSDKNGIESQRMREYLKNESNIKIIFDEDDMLQQKKGPDSRIIIAKKVSE